MSAYENLINELNQIFSKYIVPAEVEAVIRKYLECGDDEILKDCKDLAYYIFVFLPPEIGFMIIAKRLEINQKKVTANKAKLDLLKEESNRLMDDSFDLIARRSDFQKVINAMHLDTLLDDNYEFSSKYGNLLIICGVLLMLIELKYYKPRDKYGHKVCQKTVMHEFQIKFHLKNMQPCLREKGKCIHKVSDMNNIMSVLEQNERDRRFR